MRAAPRRALRAAVVLFAGALAVTACSTTPERTLSFQGPDDGALLNAEDLSSVAFVARAEAEDPSVATVDDLIVLLDGTDVTSDAEVSATELTYAPGELPDGERTVAFASRPADADGEDGEDGGGEPEVLQTWTVAVDTTPPDVELTAPDGAVVAGEELQVAGVTEPGATVRVADQEVTAGEDGSFEVTLAQAPEGQLDIVATDAAGNATADEFSLVSVPSRVHVDEIRTVHVSFCAWASPSLRDPVLQLIDDGLINAVQLDLKDETGKIGFATENELAAQSGANEPDCRIDLAAAVEQLHDLGVPVIGRMVAFADPVLAPWAWANDRPELVIQTADRDIYTGRYAGFTNFANEEIREYNISIAEEAAAMGVDHILWDYIRKPDGAVENFHFEGLDGDPRDAIVEFTRQADERLSPFGVQHGASLYGVSADRPHEVSQDVERMAEYLDYVAPMIYPSHWAAGEYGVANPLMQPGDMVRATLEVWNEATEGRRARVVPWLEDSNWPVRLGFPDRARYVREQIEATYDSGINEWMLWDSAVRYTTSALVQPPGE